MATLLLVDDDDDIVGAFGDLLREEGRLVRSASTGEETGRSPGGCRALGERRAPTSA
jgi:CheY-like chemotaxis protein